MSDLARLREAAWRILRSDETTVRFRGIRIVFDDRLDAGIGVFIPEGEEQVEAAIGSVEREIPGRDAGIEDDGGSAGTVGAKGVREVTEKSPPGATEPFAPELWLPGAHPRA